MRISNPFIPLRVKSENMHHVVDVVQRSYTFAPDGMISSIISCGEELLAEPMRIVLGEDGKDAVFDENYPENESESFIQSRSDEKAVICGCKQSERFIIDFCSSIKYDGNIDIDLKIVPKGATVAEALGLKERKPLSYKLDKLHLEIPLKKESCLFYHMYPNSDIFLEDNSIIKAKETTTSGKIFPQNFSLPFKSLFFLGNDSRGLGWFCEREKNWQCEDGNKAIEVVSENDKIILRIHLLDSHPVLWEEDYEKGAISYFPISFHFGFMATPVKPFPKNPYIHKALHLDCGIKIKGNYMDFLSSENRFDLLKEKGVDTLILHEKWNKSQNWFELSEFTANQLRFIVDKCHERGIKVLTYFGYEFSLMSPMWNELSEKVTLPEKPDGKYRNGWYRVPFQRDYPVCYNSEYKDLFVDGIARLMDTYNIDGIYLDGTSRPLCCYSESHGCLWHDTDGKVHGTYSVGAVRELFERLHNVMKERGGVINVHCRGYLNFTVLPYIDQTWYGENIQSQFLHGSCDDIDLDYFRAEYTGRNMGVPVEFIAYENRPFWTFEKALSCSLLFGILPRPNDIAHPLDVMSKVWKIFESFPIENSQWLPYWENSASSTHEKVKISYYKYTDISGETQILAFVVNISSQTIKNVSISFEESTEKIIDTKEMKEIGSSFDIEPYGHKILFIK